MLKRMIIFTFLCCVSALLYGADETVPAKVFSGTIINRGVQVSSAFVFSEKIKTVIINSTNLQLIYDYQITNYNDQSDPDKMILLNRLHGFIKGELYSSDKKITLKLTAYHKTKKPEVFQIEFSTLDEGLQKLDESLLPWLEGYYNRIPKSVVIKEEVEKISVGKFEYTKPVVIIEAGPSYTGINNNDVGIQNLTAKISGYADVTLRYEWWGVNIGGSYLPGGFSIYVGPELNTLQGFSTMTMRFGYQALESSGNSSPNLNNTNFTIPYKIKQNYLFCEFLFFSHVTEQYSFTFGGIITPLTSLSDFVQEAAPAPEATNYYSRSFQYNEKAFVFGGFIKNFFQITPDFALTLQYTTRVSMIEKADGPVAFYSLLSLGIAYNFKL